MYTQARVGSAVTKWQTVGLKHCCLRRVHIYRICPLRPLFIKFECLFELMLNVPVNSYGHVGTLPPFYGTFTQNQDVITSKKYLKYNHPSQPKRLIGMDGLT